MISMRNVQHHPKTDTLADYAAGRLDEARSVVVATHIERCQECRTAVRDLEAVAGLCLEAIEPVPMAANSMADFWAKAGDQELVLPGLPTARPANDVEMETCPPLAAFLPTSIDDLPWKQVAPGLSQYVLEAEGYREGVLRLLKIAPGTKVSTHTHGEGELTLILRGAYRDEVGEFYPGDLADLDDGVTHAPVAIGDEDCICLIATNAPLVFKDLVGKVMQPFVKL